MKVKLVVILIIISLILTSQMIVVGNELNFEDNKNEDTREDIEKIENGSVDIDEKNKRSEKENDIKENYFDQTDLREKKQRNDLGGYNVSLSAKYTYETQDPIRIDSDENFAEVAEEKNWLGNGTDENPYIIDGYEIDGEGYGYSLYIGNVTHHFEIKRCYLHNASRGIGEYFTNSGLHLFNTSNGKIQDNLISKNYQRGIYLDHANNNTVYNNTIHSNEGHEIQLEQSFDNEVIGNKIHGDVSSSNQMNSQDDVDYSKDSVLIKLESPDEDEIRYWGQEKALKFKTDEIANTIGGTTSRTYPTFNMAEISFNKGAEVKRTVESLSSMKEVIKAEPNYLKDFQEIPNDPGYDSLWAMPKIDAPDAWNVTTGSEEVVVAILDTGIDYNHPDLIDNIWTSEEGHHGYNAIEDSYDPMDYHGHGTHVAGTIGAVGDNDLGVVGVNWNVSLMGVKIGGTFGLTTADAIAGLEYVLERKKEGENIVATSNSWGGGGYSELLYEAIEKHQKEGISFVTAAGNNRADNDETPFYPANYDLTNIISVAATNETDKLADFSNYGDRSVHVGAPGANINSTLLHDEYGYASGTSMAAPHVSGLIALLKSHNASYDYNQLKNVILSSVHRSESFQNLTLAGGRINAFHALEQSPDTEDLKLWVHRPTSYSSWMKETPISISLNDGVNPILGANVSVEFSTGEESIYLEDDGSGGDRPGDGYYTSEWIPQILGMVNLTFTVRLEESQKLMRNITVEIREDSGIALLASEHNVLVGNNITDNYYGISLYRSESNKMTSNRVGYNKQAGIRFYESKSNRLANHIISNSQRGISFEDSNQNFILNNSVSECYNGIVSDSSDNTTFIGNLISMNERNGIWFDSSNNNSVIDNRVSDNSNGIFLDTSNSNEIMRNTVSNNEGNGIWLDQSLNNDIASNMVQDNGFRGIDLHRSNHTSLVNNTISNSSIGVDIARSKSVLLRNNTLIGDSINIWGSEIFWWDTHSIDTSNTVNGKPVYYLKNKTEGTLPEEAGQIILVNCTDMRVENQNVSNGTVGILLGFSDNNVVMNNTVSNNDKGIRLFKSNSNTIINNSASNNSNSWFTLSYAIWLSESHSNKIVGNTLLNNDGHSVYLTYSNYNIIYNNTASKNKWRGFQLLGSSNNTLSNNIASHSRYGIRLFLSSNDNILMNNVITNNNRSGLYVMLRSDNNWIKENVIYRNRDGIRFWDSTNNVVFNNKIIDNEVQAWDNGENDWDYGDPAEKGKGGNYWSDYDGKNRGDGIGDKPYEIEGDGNQDKYPWMTEDMVRQDEDKNILDIVLDYILEIIPSLPERPDRHDMPEIPGFTSTLLLLAVIMAVAIYKKKKR